MPITKGSRALVDEALKAGEVAFHLPPDMAGRACHINFRSAIGRVDALA